MQRKGVWRLMVNMRFLRLLGFVLALEYLVFPQMAHAYIDPCSGSYALQLLAGGALTAIFVSGNYWRRLKAFITRHLPRRHRIEQRT